MRLYEKHAPRSLPEVIGQSCVRSLTKFCEEPYPECFLLEGRQGVGKSSVLRLMPEALGCDPFFDVFEEKGADMTIDTCRTYWSRTLRLAPKGRTKALLIEELEYLSPASGAYLKEALESGMPPNTVVIATSNGASKLPSALLERFDIRIFDSGRSFAKACTDRLADIWQLECPDRPIPSGYMSWGLYTEGRSEHYSMRRALRTMQSMI